MKSKIDMTVGDLKKLLNEVTDDNIPVVIPVISQDDCNLIFGFRHVRTAGILHDEYDEEPYVLCLNAATPGVDIEDQIKNRDVVCEKVLYKGESI